MHTYRYFLFIVSLFFYYGCSLKDDKLYKKIIITSNFNIDWYSKSGLTKSYPDYIEIYNVKTQERFVLEGDHIIDDVNFHIGDTLEIMCSRQVDFEFLNKKDTLINELFIKYKKSNLDYNSPVRYEGFKDKDF